MKTSFSNTTLLLLSLALLASVSEAAVVHLKDGSRVHGTIVNATARDIQLYTDNGVLRIENGRILRIDYEGDLPTPAAPPAPGYAAPGNPSAGLRQTMSVNFGLALPASDIDFSDVGGGKARNGDMGFLFGVQYLYPLSSRLSLGPEVEFSGRGSSDSEGLLYNAHSHVSGSTFLTQAVLKYHLTDGAARPYLAAGLGAHRTTTEVDTQPLPGFSWSDTNTDETRRLVDGTDWGLASSLRFGVDIPFSDTDLFAFELGWTGLFNGRYDATAAGKDLGINGVSGPLHNVTIAARWGWRF